MKILIVWREIPTPTYPVFARPFYLAKYNKDYELTLVSFISNNSANISHIYKYFNEIELIKETKFSNIISKGIYSLISRFTYQNIRFSRDFNVFGRVYSSAMQRKILNILRSNRFDIIYADCFMHSYLYYCKKYYSNIPIILEFFHPILYALRQFYSQEKAFLRKLKFKLQYLSFKLFEIQRYSKFDGGIYVTETHRRYEKPFLPKKTVVIPPGVDLEYYKLSSNPSESPTLIYIGTMSYPVNIYAVLYFFKEIYPLIRTKIPNLKVYIVGRSPPNVIRRLALKDKSIIVTGEVKDVRPYLSKAQVVIAPITVDDGGIKNKVLEGMAMGKPVVSTSLGARDIGAVHGKNIIIADDPKEFAESVINLLQDDELRNKIGNNARKFVEKNYSWKKLTRILERFLEEFI